MVMLLVLGLVLFVLLIVVHELGHYFAAKLSGVKVEEFGVGFPPRAFGKRFKPDGTLYSVNWLPLGGFVRLKGEHDADTGPGSYGGASMSKKAFILMAGVTMNLVAAALILSVLSYSGLPRLVENQFRVAGDTEIVSHDVLVTYVAEGSPAEAAGIKVGDRIISLDGKNPNSAEELAPMTESLAGRTVPVVWSSEGRTLERDVSLDSISDEDGYLGVAGGDFIVERSGWSSPVRGVALSGQFAWLTLKGLGDTLGNLLSGQGAAAAQNVAGPVGIVVLLNDVSQAGLNFVLMFVALISVTLAVMNVLPIPALDGGRLFVSGLFGVLKKPLSAATEERIHATGMAVLMALVVVITFIDVRRFL